MCWYHTGTSGRVYSGNTTRKHCASMHSKLTSRLVTNAGVDVKKQRKLVLSARLAVQPTFGDTDDELGITDRSEKKPIAKKQKKIEASPKRLSFASESTMCSKIDALVSMGHTVLIYPMNYSISPVGNANLVECHAYRNGVQAENLDVDERTSYEPGRAELTGIAVLAYEIAETLTDDDSVAVVVVSKKGGNAARLLAGCAALAVRRIASPDKAKSIVGGHAPQPTGELKKIYDAFPKWSKVTAPHEIVSVL